MILRPYQEQAIARVRDHYAAGDRRVLLVGPTGFGKTATASALMATAVSRKKRVLFVVHRREIIADTVRRLRAEGLSVGLVLAGESADATASIQVASIQTLTARGGAPPADLVVWDEAHHVAALTYKALAEQYPRAFHLGLTATPERSDGCGLADSYDALVEATTIAELQHDGYLAHCDAVCSAESGRALAATEWDAWREHGSTRRTVIFAKHCARGREIVDHIPGSAIVTGTTPRKERAAILQSFADGHVTALVNVGVLTEGWDCPQADTVILARPYASVGPYLQCAGRVLRAYGTKRALIVDLCDAVRTHGMPQAKREWSLEGDAVKKKATRPRLCSACGACRRGDEVVCWRCSTAHPPPEVIEVAPRSLSAYSEAAGDEWTETKAASYTQLLAAAVRRGYSRGWAAHRFAEKWNHWPMRGAS